MIELVSTFPKKSAPLQQTREHLPLFKELPRPRLDIERLQREFFSYGFADYAKYTDLDFGGEYVHLCNQYNETHTKFISEEDSQKARGHYNSKMYRQLALTSFDHERFPGINLIDPIPDKRKAIRAACNRESPDYKPQLDERNYCVPNARAQGIFLEILHSFKAKFTRSRLAVLMPGFAGKPHIDYNTNYSIRIHIPIITNAASEFCYVRENGEIKKMHMPADGRMWCVNTGYTHFVTNAGKEPRVHFVVNLESQEDLYE